MSIFFQKKKNKTEESINNHKIDIYNPDTAYFKQSNIKINLNDITTERKIFDLKKSSQSIENNDTSVDMNSNYGEENIDIKNLHNFKSHLSELKFINNSKEDTTVSKEIKNSKNSEKEVVKKNNSTNNIGEKINENRNEKEFYSNKNIINEIDYFNDNDSQSNSFKRIKNLSFQEIMFFKDSQYEYKYALLERNETYRTSII